MAAKRVFRGLNTLLEDLILILLVALLFLAIYAKFDSTLLFEGASARRYETYKPTAEDELSFQELQAKNDDVLGWLSIYGTNIDYPLVQSKSGNDYYLNRDPMGRVQASGSIFLDARSDRHFGDFNTLIYGHHMAERKMFGDIDLFLDQTFFDTHKNGSLYYDGAEHGLEILSVLNVNAYDKDVYRPHVPEAGRAAYLQHLAECAVHVREGQAITALSPDARLVLLSTCSEDITNGRFVLLCRLTDRAEPNPYATEDARRMGTGLSLYDIAERAEQLSGLQWVFAILILITITATLYYIERQRRKHHEQRKK